MSWRAIIEADLLVRISGDELEGFRAAALAAGQADPVEPIIDQVTDEARGYIAACSRNTLGPAGTLPEKLIGAAVDVIVVKVMARAAGIVIDPDGARKDAGRAAVRLFENVAACRFAIEEPEEKTDEVIGAPSPKWSARDRTYDRASQDGI